MTFTRYGTCPVCGGCAVEEVDCDLGGKVVGRACMDGERHEAAINRGALTKEEAARLGVEECGETGDDEFDFSKPDNTIDPEQWAEHVEQVRARRRITTGH